MLTIARGAKSILQVSREGHEDIGVGAAGTVVLAGGKVLSRHWPWMPALEGLLTGHRRFRREAQGSIITSAVGALHIVQRMIQSVA